MRAIEKQILEFVALATPVNSNVKAVPTARADQLLAALQAIGPAGRTYEAKPLQNVIYRPSKALRAMVMKG